MNEPVSIFAFSEGLSGVFDCFQKQGPAAATIVACILVLVVLRVLWWWLFHPRLPWLFKAKVQHVCDGDSVWVKTWYGRRVKLRLAGIDAPESEQAYGDVSQRVLDDLIGGETVSVHAIDRDIYGRYVAYVNHRNQDVCLFMLEAGAAWPYYAYLNRFPEEIRRKYKAAAQRAKAQRIGLWGQKSWQSPWDWRKQHRSIWARLMYPLRRLLRWLRKVLGF